MLTDRYIYLLSNEKNESGSYDVLININLKMIEYITVGFDHQCINIHCRGKKFKTEHSGHIVKHFTIETASKELGKKIIWVTRKAFKIGNMDTPQVLVRGTESVMALRKFLASQSNSDPKIVFHGLTYWKEVESSKNNEVNGYILIRHLRPGLFKNISSYTDWQRVYASLK